MMDLGVLGTKAGLQSFAYGLNNIGDVVGATQTDSSSSGVAFLYHDGTMRDLNNLVDPALGWQLEYATGINDLGQVIGVGATPAGSLDSYLLTPVVPEPGSVGVFLATLAWGLCGRRRHQRIMLPANG